MFPVHIDTSQSVGDLKEAIKEKNLTTITCDAKDLQLFLANKDQGFGAWLTDDDSLDAVLQSRDVSSYVKMRASWKLSKPSLFGSNVSLEEDTIHVLVVVPHQGTSVPIAKYEAFNLEEPIPAHDEGKPDDVILVQFAGDGMRHTSPLSYQQQKIFHSCNTSSHILYPSFLCRLQLGRWSEPIARIQCPCHTVITCFAL